MAVDASATVVAADRKRWLAFVGLCLGVFMIVLDTTIVNVALPSIRREMRFSDTGLVWVVNAYLLSFGGFLLLSGRLGDLYGRRRVFLFGIVLFTVASLACGMASTPAVLVTGRFIQGLGGAAAVAVALSLIVTMFPDPHERAKAMSLYSFVSAGGGSVGLLLGGILTSTLDWHWAFLVNVPIGVLVFALGPSLLPRGRAETGPVRLDIWGALLVTSALMIAVYTLASGSEIGWSSARVLGLLGAAVALLVAFVLVEASVPMPLMPPGIFALRSFTVSNIVRVLWAAGSYSWFFTSALYLQLVLGYQPMQAGLSFLPSHLVMAVFAAGVSARLIGRYGVTTSLVVGLLLVASGMALFARIPVDGRFLTDVIPAMMLIGVGAGIGFGPLLLAAMTDVPAHSSGLASGIVNTTPMIGGAL